MHSFTELHKNNTKIAGKSPHMPTLPSILGNSSLIQLIKDNDPDYVPPGSRRQQYMGSTPRKDSSVGRAVIDRMRTEGHIRSNDSEFWNFADGLWYDISEADMSHYPVSAVAYWNSEGYRTGPQSDAVYTFMHNPDNYVLEHYSTNRSRDHGTVYRDPV